MPIKTDKKSKFEFFGHWIAFLEDFFFQYFYVKKNFLKKILFKKLRIQLKKFAFKYTIVFIKINY